jgi:hypothetical protein
MLKNNFRTYLSFCVCTLVAFLSVPAASDEIRDKTVSGRNFVVEVSSTVKPPNPDGIWGVMKLVYKLDDSRKSPEIYIFPIRAPAVVRGSKFGLVTISEKTGGMNGTYTVTYLYPTDGGLTTIGAIESGIDNGKYKEINRISPEWVKGISVADRARLIQSISVNHDDFVRSSQAQSLDDAMLFFVMPDLMREIRKRDSGFPVDYSNYLGNEVNSSMANLIRREFLGGKISLCDSDQLDVFACSVGEKAISVCMGNKEDDVDTLQYRVGVGRKVELSLEKPFPHTVVGGGHSEFFDNGDYRYTVKFGNGKDSDSAGVIVEKNGAIVSRQQCHPERFEPYLLPKM